jgi:MFS family permease
VPFAALRHRDFRLLWSGQVVSIAGSQMQVVALHVQVYQLARQIAGANPALYLGLIGLMQLLPLLILGLGAGVLADRFDRRSVMLITQTMMMGFSILLAALTWLGAISLPVLYLIVALTFATRTFDTPSRQALVPALVPRETLPNALSLNMIAWQFGHIVGPALGGLLVARTSIALIYAIDALSFGAVLLSLLLMRHRHVPPPPTRGSPATAARGSVLEGLRFVWSSPIILSTMLLDFVATFFGAAMTLLPLFADQILHIDARGLGLMYAAPAVGALGAALVMSWLGQVRHQGKTVLVAVVLYGLATAVFGWSRWLPLTLLALAGTGAADTVSAVLRGTIRQIATPDQLRGRATSVNMIFFQGGPLLGEFEAGVAATLLGAPLAVGLGGLACVLATLIIAWRVPGLRSYDQ